MKPFHLAIASIVDANTGFGLIHHSGGIDYREGERRAHRIRSRSFIDYLQRIRDGFSAVRDMLRQRRKLQQNLRQLNHLTDRLLMDIGLTRGDIIAARSGALDLDGLMLRRLENRDSHRVKINDTIELTGNRLASNAVNETVFAKAKCA